MLLGNLGQWPEPPLLVIGGFFWIMVGLLLVAWWLERPVSPQTLWRPNRLWMYALLAGASGFIIIRLFLASIIADIYFKKGQAYDSVQRYETSVQLYLEALRWAPTQDFYYLFLGRAYLEMAKRLPDRPMVTRLQTVSDLYRLDLSKPQNIGRELLLNASLIALKEARKVNPLNTDNSANLARLHRFWAEASADAAKRSEHLEAAEDYYRQATNLSPNAAHLYDEWGAVLHLQGRFSEAIEKYERALQLDPKYPVTYVYLGDAYLAQGLLDRAAEMYRQALSLDDSLAGAHSALAYIYRQLSNLQEALREGLRAVELLPNDPVTRRNLAILYRELGMLDQALAEAEAALRLSPRDQQLQSLVEQLKLERR